MAAQQKKFEHPSLNIPAVMGILNITPDSFSDGGQHFHTRDTASLDQIVQRALKMQEDGASIVDIGGESTRPGAMPVSEQQELDRVIPVIERICSVSDLRISIDTSKSRVMAEAISAGATFINDVYALRNTGSLEVVAKAISEGKDIAVCLMHMQKNPQDMQQAPQYQHVVSEVIEFLQSRIQACETAGIEKSRLLVDPGFGFGKTLEHNLQLLRHLGQLSVLGCPVLVGLSRKSLIGQLTHAPEPAKRLAGSLALAWACATRGAKIVRVHDVKETVDFFKIMAAL